MQANTLYDKIVSTYNHYQNHLKYIDKKKKDFLEQKMEIAKKIMDSDSQEDIEELSFTIFIEDKIRANDVNLLFNNLYNLVESYTEIEDSIILPKEITDLCTSYSNIVMKTMFVVNDDLTSEERVRGSIDKIKESLKSSGEIKNMVEHLKKLTTEVGNS
jgi:hypothetical protein